MTNNIPFFNNTSSLPIEAIIQLHEEEITVVVTSPSVATTSIIKYIRLSKIPGLIDSYNYLMPDAELIELLNYNFRLSPDLMYAVAKLHAGAIVYSEDSSLLLLFCEAYCRSKSVDIHACFSMKFIPNNKLSLFVGICEESDGFGVKTS